VSKRRLGKGIDALLQGRDLEQLSNMARLLQVEIDRLHPNPKQPRTRFNDDSLQELANSIREKGVIQPILAEDQGDGTYTIIAGERRYRAAKIAGLTEIPVIPQDFSEEEKLEIALVENLQREDLNPIDEAIAFDAAMQNAGYTQDQLAQRLGKSRSAIANGLRLLKLDTRMQEALASGQITAGHARALLAINKGAERKDLFKRIQAEGLSVREAEAAGRPTDAPSADEPRADVPPADAGAMVIDDEGDVLEGPPAHTPATERKSPELQRLEDELVRILGTKVVIRGGDQTGRIEIAYYSTGDLDRLIELLGVSID
jgi:ParB family transcriptional regulator, chromosome partitioning protein